MPVNLNPALRPIEPQGADSLANERATASFDVAAMTEFIYGAARTQRRREIAHLVASEPVFNKTDRFFNSRTERYQRGLEIGVKRLELVEKHNLSDEDHTLLVSLLDEPGPFSLHVGMFLPTIVGQGTEEQKKKWLPLAYSYQIIGCYAQTELGHGSNVQGLETTATYIPETQEFEIHSPTMTASKWWIGGLGKTASHAVVIARLITRGTDYGPHPFIVPLRNRENHQPLPGVTVGDIGPKYGYNVVDNGFVLFDHVRIPRDNMLMRYSRVEPNGEYIRPPNAKLSYGTMLMVRAYIVDDAGRTLARAATIAVRYSAVRRQFHSAVLPSEKPDSETTNKPTKANKQNPETAVIDYQIQAYRLFPIIAQAYALLFTGREMMRLYAELTKSLQAGNLELLPEVHATSSGLKSLTTDMALAGIEDCRRSCGGHGFSMFSGLPDFLSNYSPNVTFEGDNYILTQQTTRYLVKVLRSHVRGQGIFTPNTEYLRNAPNHKGSRCRASNFRDLYEPDIQLAAFAHRAGRLVWEVVNALDAKGKQWNDCLVDVYRASRAHCQYVVVRNFIQGINDARLQKNPALAAVLKNLCHLFVLHTVEKELGEFLEDGYLNNLQADAVRDAVRSLLKTLRPDAVSLVDAFDIPDYLLNSALGRYDGRVYESMFDLVKKEPLNQTDAPPGFDKYIKPLFEGKGPKARL